MKAFFKSVLRIATAILLVVAVAGLLVWGFKSWSSYRNASLEKPREWPIIEGYDNTTFTLSTMWKDGWMAYKFEVKRSQTPPTRKKQWVLEFIDSNGFEVFHHAIRNVSTIVGPKGETTGFEARSRTLIGADDYRRAKTVEVSWID